MKKVTLKMLTQDARRASIALAMVAQCEDLTDETRSDLLRIAGEILSAIQRLECDSDESGVIK